MRSAHKTNRVKKCAGSSQMNLNSTPTAGKRRKSIQRKEFNGTNW